jgi:hypothetical protein
MFSGVTTRRQLTEKGNEPELVDYKWVARIGRPGSKLAEASPRRCTRGVRGQCNMPCSVSLINTAFQMRCRVA